MKLLDRFAVSRARARLRLLELRFGIRHRIQWPVRCLHAMSKACTLVGNGTLCTTPDDWSEYDWNTMSPEFRRMLVQFAFLGVGAVSLVAFLASMADQYAEAKGDG